MDRKQQRAMFARMGQKGSGRAVSWELKRGVSTAMKPGGRFYYNPRWSDSSMDKDKLKDINMRRGYHFFDPSAMRFFNSRLSGSIARRGDAAYFVTSERHEGRGMDGNYQTEARKYSVRKMNLKTGATDEVSKFQEYDTAAAAKKAMMKAAGRY